MRHHAFAFLLAMGFALALPAPASHAQTGSTGTISGVVNMATSGERLDASLLAVEVIILADGGVTGTKAATVQGDTYEVQVDADADLTYVPRATYDGVPYFSGAVTLGDDKTAARDFTVYATTQDPPDLRVADTLVTVVALDRGQSQLGFIRDDLVVNPSDRVFIGSGQERITLRYPAPEDTLEVAGENADGRFELEGGVVTTTTPLRPGETPVVTRYLVSYDRSEDSYTLRLTAPVATARAVLRVPEGYARALTLEGDAVRGEPQVVEVSEGESVTFRVIEATDLGPGDGLVVTLDGFAPEVNSNVLTDSPQAIIAIALALVVLGGAAAYALARPRGARPSEAT
ncbi:MAG: hypothetical protein M0R73_10915 [Dehalococcoidia bacterium]|nr:hypothetical protein [Dehalococcoidia bacterium]